MYEATVTINNEGGATADQFVAAVTDINAELNRSWAKVKSNLPTDQQAAAEVKVRTVLHA